MRTVVSSKVVDRIQARVLDVFRDELGEDVEIVPEDVDRYVTEIIERELFLTIDYKS